MAHPTIFWHFDFDGTLFHTTEAIRMSYSRAAAHFGGVWTSRASQILAQGESAEKFLPACDWSREGFNLLEVRKMKDDFYAEYFSSILPNTKVLDLAINLSPNVAIVTSSSRKPVEKILDHFNVFEFFASITTREDVDSVKPAPELYELSVARNPARFHIAIEDSQVGVDAAVAAGLLTLTTEEFRKSAR